MIDELNVTGGDFAEDFNDEPKVAVRRVSNVGAQAPTGKLLVKAVADSSRKVVEPVAPKVDIESRLKKRERESH